jgi:D-alanyl-D-alanine dipeptidase
MTAGAKSHDYSDRLARASKEAERAALDALLVTPGPDLLYLIGYDPPPLERLTTLVIRPGNDPVLLVPRLERPRAAASPAGTLVQIESWGDGQDPYESIRRLVSGSAGSLGTTDRTWAVHLLALEKALPATSFHSAGATMSRLRARKDPGEVELLAKAGLCTDEAFGQILGEGLRDHSERQVAGSLAGHLLESGLESVAFTIVGSGPNGASPHHDPGDRIVRHGDTVVLDFGGRVAGYCSDMTRTVSVGESGAEAREIHAIVAEAQEAAFRAVGPGVPAQEIDRIARGVISSAGHGDRFFHRTGHGIGLEEHEDPYIVEGNTEPLEPGMCFSIEPGIYVEGRFGVRIEDIVAVTDSGAVRLNEVPRDLTVVD